MENEFRTVAYETIVDEAQKIAGDKYRLIQICATKLGEKYEILYTFGLDYDTVNLKVELEPGTELASITKIYPCAYLYENEIHDLFGIKVTQMNLDFHGGLYRTAVKTPFK